MTFSSGTSNVTVWGDKANGSNATANTPIAYASNGLGTGYPALTFTGSQWLLGNTSVTGTGLTIFSVFNMSNSSAGIVGRIVALAATGANDYNTTSYVFVGRKNGVTAVGPYRNGTAPAATVSYSTPTLNTTYFDGTNAYTSTNGGTPVTAASSGSFAVTAYAIGNDTNTGDVPNGSFNGYISEVLVYNATLTASQRQTIEGYLAWKWGLQSNLPSGHPFYAIKPFSRVFSPLDVPSCQLWLDGQDASSFTFSTGSNISVWKDKSGLSSDATASGTPVLTANSINGYTSVATPTGPYFTGSMSITSNTLTCFVVATTTASLPLSGNDQRLVSLENTTNVDYGRTDGVIALFNQNTTSTIATYRASGPLANNTISTNVPFLAVSEYDGTNAYLWQNGTAGTLASSASTGNFTITKYGIGNQANPTTEYWRGYIGEVIIYNTALTAPQRQQIEGYLAAKWGLSLPSPVSSPLSISGCSLWLDAADASTITGTTSVTAWTDKSGNANNAVFDTNKPSYTPSNKYIETTNNNTHIRLPVAAFTNTTNQTAILFIVYADKQEGSNNQGLFSTSDYGLYQILRAPTYYPYIIRGNITSTDPDYVAFKGRLATTNALIYSMQYTAGVTGAANYSVAPNGNYWHPVSVNTQNVSGDIYLGGISSFDTAGDIHANLKIYEVIAYNNTVLTTYQRQQVETYLSNKWGISTATVVTSHPFSKFPPLTPTPLAPVAASSCTITALSTSSTTIQWAGSANTEQYYWYFGTGAQTGVLFSGVVSVSSYSSTYSQTITATFATGTNYYAWVTPYNAGGAGPTTVSPANSIIVYLTPPSFLYTGSSAASLATTATVTVTISAYTVAVIFSGAETTNSTVSQVTAVSGGGLTWAYKYGATNIGYNGGAGRQRYDIWYAVNNSATTISSATMTITYSASFDDQTAVICTFTGCNLTNPWSSAAPASFGYTASSTAIAATVPVSAIPEAGTGVITFHGTNYYTTSPGVEITGTFTQLNGGSNGGAAYWEYNLVQYKTFTTPQSATTLTMNTAIVYPLGLSVVLVGV